jgi:hypothetical protein
VKKLAIVFYHIGVSDYQWFTLDLAVKKNPDAEIVLITDVIDAERPEGVTVVDVMDYYQLVLEFDKHYMHLTSCKYPFGYRGITRWLVYNEWWKQNPEKDLFVADSDVMICSDLCKEQVIWSEKDYTLSMATAGGQSFWFNQEVMQALSDLILRVYKNKNTDESKKILGHYDELQKYGLPGGVCDMTFLGYIGKQVRFNRGETTLIVNESTFDHNFLMSQGYEFHNGRKVVNWKKGHPYCLELETERLVKFHTLHMSCSGGLIEPFYKEAIK